jgi:hypothetical protein
MEQLYGEGVAMPGEIRYNLFSSARASLPKQIDRAARNAYGVRRGWLPNQGSVVRAL